MLEFAEAVLKEIRRLREDTSFAVLSNRVKDMEQYKQLMDRLEGYTFVEDAVKQLLKSNPDLQDL